MRIYWWQDGLHIKPESAAEHDALAKLTNTIKSVAFGHEQQSTQELTSSDGRG